MRNPSRSLHAFRSCRRRPSAHGAGCRTSRALRRGSCGRPRALRAPGSRGGGAPSIGFALFELAGDVRGALAVASRPTKPCRVHREEELADRARPLHHVLVGDLEARLAVRQRAAQQLDHQRQRIALRPADRQHRALHRDGRIGGSNT